MPGDDPHQPASRDLTELHLDVYDTRRGPWNPEHGPVDIPEDWEFLPSGDAFVTHQVTSAGRYWVAWRPRGRNRPHRRRLGLWAPIGTIDQARQAAEQTSDRRARARKQGARHRASAEGRYQEELTAAIVEYLAFAPSHRELAERIAAEASRRAAEVGSGRVGRTRKLTLDERAALAARAWIRHRFTDYEDRLGDAQGDDVILDELDYREIKSEANAVVDDFLADHRGPVRP